MNCNTSATHQQIIAEHKYLTPQPDIVMDDKKMPISPIRIIHLSQFNQVTS